MTGTATLTPEQVMERARGTLARYLRKWYLVEGPFADVAVPEILDRTRYPKSVPRSVREAAVTAAICEAEVYGRLERGYGRVPRVSPAYGWQLLREERADPGRTVRKWFRAQTSLAIFREGMPHIRAMAAHVADSDPARAGAVVPVALQVSVRGTDVELDAAADLLSTVDPRRVVPLLLARPPMSADAGEVSGALFAALAEPAEAHDRGAVTKDAVATSER